MANGQNSSDKWFLNAFGIIFSGNFKILLLQMQHLRVVLIITRFQFHFQILMSYHTDKSKYDENYIITRRNVLF